MPVARGTFQVDLSAGGPELDGAVARSNFSKSWEGDLEATGQGLMLSVGDPAAGEAGYVAIESVTGRLAERDGSFALQQFGMLVDGRQSLSYEIVPGSGSGELDGIVGVLNLTIEDDGTHRYELEYEF